MDIPTPQLFNKIYQQLLLTVTPHTPVIDVIHQMNQTQTSCVLVVEQQQLVGIFTERDVVRVIANQTTFKEMPIAALMTQPVITLSEQDAEDLPTVIEKFNQHHIRHLPVINAQGQVLGVVTPVSVNAHLSKLPHLAANSPAMIYTLVQCPNGLVHFEYMSSALEQIQEIKCEQVLKDAMLCLAQIHPDDVQGYNEAVSRSYQNLEPFSHEWRIITPSGKLKWLQARSVPERRSNGDVAWHGVALDVSEDKRLQAELQEHIQFMEQVINHSPQLLYIFDPVTGSNVYLNQQSLEILGYTPEEIQQRGANFFLDVLHPHDLHLLERNLNYWKNSPTDEVLTTEYRMQHKDGSWQWLRSQEVVFVRNESNLPTKVLGTTQDISESKQAELEIIRSRDLREAIFNESADALFLVDSTTLLTTDCNQRAVELFAVSDKAELIGIEGQTLQKHSFTPEELTRIVEEINQQGFWSRELEYVTKLGNSFWGNLAIKQIRVAGQRINLVRVTDISQRKRAEETLRKNEALLAESQQVARLGNWEYDLETGKITWSKGLFDLFHRDPAQLEPDYEENLQLYHPEDQEKLHQAVKRAIATGESYKDILRVPQSDGSHRYFEGIGHAQFNANGQVIRLYGTAQDVTERIQAEMSLKESELRFRAIFNNTFQFTGLLTVDGILLEVNQTALTFGGLKREDVINRPFWDTYWWTISPQTQEQLKQAIALAAQGEFVRYEVDVLGANHRVGTIDFTLRPLQNEAGEIVLLIPEGRDISEQQAALRDRQLAQAALTKSEEQLRLTLDFAHIGSWDWNLQTGEVIWNENHYRLLGLKPETSVVKYQLWRDRVHPEDIEQVKKAILQALTQHRDYEAKYRVIHPDGKIRWLIGKGRGIYNQAGDPIRMLGVVIDISEQETALCDRQRAEQALQEKETFLRSIYNGVGESIFVIDVLDDFRYVGLNPSHERRTGYTSNQIQGKTPEQVLPPDLAAAVRQHYQDCVDAGETITYEECLPFQNQETWWLTSLTPLRNENSRIYRIIGNSVNITERKRAEKMLDLQAVITRNMAEGICLVRAADNIIVYANPKFKQMFGYEPGELIGQHVSIINYDNHHTTPEDVIQAIRTLVLEHGEATYEVHNVKKDGTPIWCSATTSVFEHPEYGTVFVAVQQDITEHKQAEEKIKASLKEKEVLLKEIHHRVKNNLGIVSSLLQMQCRRTEDSQASAILLDSQNRIASIALVHEKLYRTEKLAYIDFNQYIPDLTTHLFDSYNISSSQIKLNIQVDRVSLDIETAIPCGLIINELVSNALKYAFPHKMSGEIQVSFYQEHGSLMNSLDQNTLTLIIRDNGIGLPTDFDSKKTKTLGLTLVHGLVHQLRGKIEIGCQQGTEFIITFTKGKG